MKLFTQLALVTAIATCGSAAYAMQSMDDAALSDTTGQDGITILIAPPTLTAAQQTSLGVSQVNGILIGAAVLHDKDGFAGSLGGGAIILGDAKQANAANLVGKEMGIFGSSAIIVNIDASNGQATTGLGGTAPVLNVNVVLPTDLMIRTGDISIDGSARAGIATGAAGVTATSAATGGTTGNAIKVLDSLDIALGGASMNIQLGNTPQGAMIKMNGTITDGLTISGLALHDGTKNVNLNMGTGVNEFNGDLGVSTITLKDHNGSNLTLDASVNIVNNAGSALAMQVYSSAAAQSQGAAIVAANAAAAGNAAGAAASAAWLVANPGDTVGAAAAATAAYGPAAATAATATQNALATAVQGQIAAHATAEGGLIITSGGAPLDVMMQNVTLGNAASTLGDLQLINVQAAGTKIAIMGH